MPTIQFVCQPLAITLCSVGANHNTVYITVVFIETGIPLTKMCNGFAIQGRLIALIIAKTGGTYGGTITTGQTGLGNLFPRRTFGFLL
jgi:hypothetical protein